MLNHTNRVVAAAAMGLAASMSMAQWADVAPDHVRSTNAGSVGIGVSNGAEMFGKLTVFRPTGDSAAVWARRGTMTNPPPIDPAGSAFYGESAVAGSATIVGHNAYPAGGRAIGVWGISDAPNGMAVAAWARSFAGANIGLYATTSSPEGYAALFQGRVFATGPVGVNVAPTSDMALGASGSRIGLFAVTTSANLNDAAVYGNALNPAGNAGLFIGRVRVDGNLEVQGNTTATGTKAFRIDHPLDPANKSLYHYSAESPEVINFYRGTVTLDGQGWARVELPAYFEAINRDPSYTLTAVGAPMPLLHVSREVEQNSFEISGGVPGMKVSWRVDAVRSDAHARAAGAPVEVLKTAAEREAASAPRPAIGPLPTVPRR